MLQGRAQFTFGEMRHRNHILLYTHVLGILELLQPFIFLEEYTTAFSSALAAYFELIKVMYIYSNIKLITDAYVHQLFFFTRLTDLRFMY